MTEAINPFEQDHSHIETIQCHLCLRDISFDPSIETVTLKGYVQCSHCSYRQPTTNKPRGRDLAIFSISLVAVYVTTIVAIILSR